MQPVRRFLLPLLAVVLLLLCTTEAARADVIHLRTGEAVKGRPVQERSNDNYLTVEDYLTGAMRRFAWEAVDPADRDRIQEQWGLKNTGESVIEGDRVVIRLDDGSTEEVLGLAERETEASIFVRRNGELLEVPKARVVEREPEPMDVRQIWSPQQLVDRLTESMKNEGVDFENLTARHQWRIGTYAEWVGALEVARDAYAAAATDEEFLKKDLAAQRLTRVEALLQDQAALETLKDARLKLGMNLFRKVREILDGFAEKHPEASETVLAQAEKRRADFNERRTKHLQRVAKLRFVDVVEDLIREKLREKDLTVTDLTSWTRRELPEAAFQILAEKHMGKFDDVTPEEARTFWEGRAKRQWRRSTYGAGTFIVDPPKIKPPKRRTGGRSGGRGQGGGSGARIQIPKPPTRDQWWEEISSPRERQQWVLAYFVERSELFELGDREYRPCSLCHGVGLLSKTLQTGDVLSYLCTRCGGAQQDVIVKYR